MEILFGSVSSGKRNKTTKAKQQQEQWDLNKLKVFCTSKETDRKMKRWLIDQEKIFANDTTKGNQSWIFTGRTDAELKLQYFDHLMWRADSSEKTLMLGKLEGRRRMGQQRTRWLDGITNSMISWASSRSWWWTGKPGMLQSMGLQRIRHEWANELNWWLIRAF